MFAILCIETLVDTKSVNLSNLCNVICRKTKKKTFCKWNFVFINEESWAILQTLPSSLIDAKPKSAFCGISYNALGYLLFANWIFAFECFESAFCGIWKLSGSLLYCLVQYPILRYCMFTPREPRESGTLHRTIQRQIFGNRKA